MESETNPKKLKIFIFGGGTLGGIYTYLLSTSKSAHIDITIACRGNYSTVLHSGFKITSNNWGNHSCTPHRVVSSPSEITGETYDYIIVTTKVLPESTLPLSSFPIAPSTPIVLIQNGVGIEKPYRDAFPQNPIASGVAYITASQPTPGHIVQTGRIANMTLGLYDNADVPADRERIKYLAGLLDASGFRCGFSEAIHVDRWGKLGWNGSWNVVCAVTNLDTQTFLASSPQAAQLVESIIREVARTANAVGVAIDEDSLVEERMEWTLRAPPIVPSMLQDARRGIQMEVEAYCGNVWRIAESAGVQTPYIKSMYTILASMNARFKASNTAASEIWAGASNI